MTLKTRNNGAMKFIGRIPVLFCLFFMLLSLAGCSWDKTNPYIEKLDIEITLDDEGGAYIKETHVVSFDYREDDWWNYYKVISLNDSGNGNYGNTKSKLTDFSVSVDGANYPCNYNDEDPDYMTEWDIARYAGNSYTYSRGDGIEVGVFMPGFSSGVKTIVFSYHLSDVVVSYADCAGFYYKFVDESNTMTVKSLTARVNFKRTDRNDAYLWTHIDDGNGEGIFADGETVDRAEYRAENLPENTYFETRLLLPKGDYLSGKSNNANRDSVIAEETEWQENFLREAKRAYIIGIVDIVLACAVAAGAIVLIVVIIVKSKPKPLPDSPEYLREIPDGWTAGEMAPLYHYYGKWEISDAIGATILDLARRHYIDIVPEGDDVRITARDLNVKSLRPHERMVFEMLTYNVGKNSFTMREFEKRVKSNYLFYQNKTEEFKEKARGMTEGMRLYPKKHGKFSILVGAFSTIAIVLGAVFLFNSLLIGLLSLYLVYGPLALLIFGITVKLVMKKYKEPLPTEGQRHYDKFHALGKFMTDFSNMKEHDLPQLILWEEYMVYATAMGIADKVAEKLEAEYPEYKEAVSRTDDRGVSIYTILYLTSPSFRFFNGMGFVATVLSLDRNVKQMAHNAKVASSARKFGSGNFGGGFHGGGGFSGGGGGFGGGGMGAR